MSSSNDVPLKRFVTPSRCPPYFISPESTSESYLGFQTKDVLAKSIKIHSYEIVHDQINILLSKLGSNLGELNLMKASDNVMRKVKRPSRLE
ncbi:MAG: hypothetical protein WAK50_17460 [Nitrososphaeraceae archaeon]